MRWEWMWCESCNIGYDARYCPFGLYDTVETTCPNCKGMNTVWCSGAEGERESVRTMEEKFE
jgi:hypothetical protein